MRLSYLSGFRPRLTVGIENRLSFFLAVFPQCFAIQVFLSHFFLCYIASLKRPIPNATSDAFRSYYTARFFSQVLLSARIPREFFLGEMSPPASPSPGFPLPLPLPHSERVLLPVCNDPSRLRAWLPSCLSLSAAYSIDTAKYAKLTLLFCN